MAVEKKKGKLPDPGLFAKIRKIQSEAESSKQDATVSMGGRTFKATSIESVLDTYLPLLEKYNMALVPIKQELIQPVNPHDFMVNFTYALIDIDTGEAHEFNVYSNGVDGSDKATGKAATYALKYAYLQLFSGRRGEDPDTANTVTNSQHKQTQPAQNEPVKQDEKKPAEDKKPEGKKETKQESQLSVACVTIKQHFDIKEIAETMDVPKWPAVKAFTAGIVKDYKDAAVKAQVNDFAAYWWTCCKVAGCKDVADAEEVYAKGKGKMTKSQREFIESMINKRKEAKSAASSSVEREPGEDG